MAPPLARSASGGLSLRKRPSSAGLGSAAGSGSVAGDGGGGGAAATANGGDGASGWEDAAPEPEALQRSKSARLLDAE